MKMKKRRTRDENILDTLKNSKWFINECDKIKEKYEASGNSLVILHKGVKKLTRHLPAYWENSVRRCVLTGKFELPTVRNARIVFQKNFKTNETELFVQIFKKTTKQDVLNIWGAIEKWQKHLNEIYAPGISDTRLQVFELWKELCSRDERPRNVTREIRILLHDRHSVSLDEQTIRKIVSGMRKQLNVSKKHFKK